MYEWYDELTRKKLTLLDAIIEAKKQDDNEAIEALVTEILKIYGCAIDEVRPKVVLYH